MSNRTKTRFPGVYSRKVESRRVAGRPDVAYDITFHDASGRKVWERVGAASEGYTAAMAAHILAERKRAIRHGDLLPVKPGTRRTTPSLGAAWNAYRKDWLDHRSRNTKPDASRWDTHLARHAGTPLSSITPAWLDALGNRLGARLSPQSVRHVLALLRRVVRHAIRSKLWPGGQSPFTDYALPVTDNARTRFLQPDEAEILLLALKNHSLAMHRMALLSLHTGMRLGEIHALRWEHVDLENCLVHVVDTKSGRNRPALLTERAAQSLQDQCDLGTGRGLVFPGRQGKQRKDVSDTFVRVVAALGLNRGVRDRRQRVVFHTLRHTYASWLAMAGMSMREIGELMGHTTEAMTRRYAKLSPEGLRRSLARVPALHAIMLPHGGPPAGPQSA